MLTIRTVPDIILRTVCRPDFVVAKDMIDQMFQLMVDANGLGLAAPQIGIAARFFVTRWGELFANPEIVERSLPCMAEEGCLSLPGVICHVPRHAKIVLRDGRAYDDWQAIVVQHELDHLNGTLITDYR